MRFPNFTNQMIALRDRAAKQGARYGIPNIRSLVIVTNLPGEERLLEILPSPTIDEIDTQTQQLEGLSNVSGVVKTYEVKGVSRRYTREQLEDYAVTYLVDAKVKSQEVVGGKTCHLVKLTERTTTWEMTLEERIGERNFY